MKRILYFILFFVLSISFYVLVVKPDEEVVIGQNIEFIEPVENIINASQHLDDKYEAFKLLLQQKKWMHALDLYRNYYTEFLELEGVDSKNHPLKAQLINTMLFLSASDDQQELNTLVNYTLSIYPQDVDFIQVKMNLMIGMGEVSAALDFYFTKLDQFDDDAEKQFFAERFGQWLDNQFDIWFSNQSYQSIELVWKKLVRFDSEQVKWQVQLTKSLIWQKKYKEALVVIKPFEHDWDYQYEIEDLLQLIENNYEEKNIKLFKIGSHYQVDVLFMDDKIYPDEAKLRLLIDTGASFTVIDQQVFDELFVYLNVSYVKTVNANTANGLVAAKMYKVDRFLIGEYFVDDFNFIVLDLTLDGSGTQGLLGMNFLQNFEFNIDQVNRVLYLSK
ncbi:MAG: clan AA aspartic protease [Saccharospirillaceae bacterium]|nr:retroviral-like aspartic protease family protein [Pseudomonadales bacterium]NRB78882.1 clan AA aspartic protease [Saccharospirillaceae bacterium]